MKTEEFMPKTAEGVVVSAVVAMIIAIEAGLLIWRLCS